MFLTCYHQPQVYSLPVQSAYATSNFKGLWTMMLLVTEDYTERDVILPATDPWEVDKLAAMTASVAPTAKPTSAAVRAAMSFMPSPQNIVVCPRPCTACSACSHQLKDLYVDIGGWGVGSAGAGGGGGGRGER